MTLTYASMFTGIGGFELGFQSVGWEPTVMVEIDPHCQRVLSEHFPSVPLKGDIRDVCASDICGTPDLYIGGFPCQDTSIAAPNRLGLDGKRSGLYFEFTRLLDEYLRLVEANTPRWVVIENPDGLLKSRNGRDMAAVVSGLADLGYGWAYRVVDGNDLGTSQRRRRVVIVGHRGLDPRPAWAALGESGASDQTDRPDSVRRAPDGLGAVSRSLADCGVTFWRKSARARASLDKGGYETWVKDDRSNTLTGFDGGNALRQTHLIAQNGRVRTLTPLEWERLQGFPDGWTQSMPLSSRYTALGNAIHVPTAAWIARRIAAVHNALALIP